MNQKRPPLPPTEELPLLEAIQREAIRFDFRQGRRRRRALRLYLATVALTLVLAVLTLTALATGAGKPTTGTESGLPQILSGILMPDRACIAAGLSKPTQSKPTNPSPLTPETLYQWSADQVPEGHLPIIPMDLSLTAYGNAYFHNLTGLIPDAEALLKQDWSADPTPTPLALTKSPRVLILHTHGTESYSPDGALSYREEDLSVHSDDPQKSVVAVGEALADTLNRQGIATVHCTVLHDASGYRDSYARAEETIRQYLEQYPTIRLVIDLHRDSILKSTGEMVRPVSIVDGEAAAQVMCVVGSSWGGEENPRWENNLALALQLRKRLNEQYENLCRPPYLQSATYNQELAPASLLLEIGACGNSLGEAERSAVAVGNILAQMMKDL